jgi:hypothetical protein
MFDNELRVAKDKESCFADISRVDESSVAYLKENIIPAIA